MEKKNVIAIVGYSGSGKTTLVERLIRHFKAKNIRLATLKHDAHAFEIDKEGKDSYRFAQAGSDVVILTNKHQYACLERLNEELSVDELLDRAGPADLYILEGYKRSDYPKIEVYRPEAGHSLLADSGFNHIKAIATNDPTFRHSLPVLDLDNTEDVAAFIETLCEESRETPC